MNRRGLIAKMLGAAAAIPVISSAMVLPEPLTGDIHFIFPEVKKKPIYRMICATYHDGIINCGVSSYIQNTITKEDINKVRNSIKSIVYASNRPFNPKNLNLTIKDL